LDNRLPVAAISTTALGDFAGRLGFTLTTRPFASAGLYWSPRLRIHFAFSHRALPGAAERCEDPREKDVTQAIQFLLKPPGDPERCLWVDAELPVYVQLA
jgi:hypothetical protein